MVSARLLILLAAAACATALPAAQPAFALRAGASPAPALAAQRNTSPASVTAVERLRGGGLPPTDVIIKTCIGGAIGAFVRAYLQNMVPEISKYGPWKHIVGVNAFGAMLVGIATSGGMPKNLVPLVVPAVRIISAIITVDSYNLFNAGKQNEAAFLLAMVVPMNLLFNHIGRTIVAPALGLK
eukprot:CAMPEP_0206251698 /NCGR_PEP_ID=MMETSP0047_2-20121206/22168_1 /ASSEMBLY_ACC=CAM_ASM_000192 /TAXON_ID=195065 /ORGANISM="Chroomonas mesostigmatica_cf, Strain CCMP1168" /LENGTH=182 /DNA_ID=CAMNT_0053677679 /DNA_START=38 /DNA_END=586 /DNA_ORIENTATION=+